VFGATTRSRAGRAAARWSRVRRLIQGGRLLVVAAEYSLETGIVELLDGVPEAWPEGVASADGDPVIDIATAF